jgi:hypothetical protein
MLQCVCVPCVCNPTGHNQHPALWPPLPRFVISTQTCEQHPNLRAASKFETNIQTLCAWPWPWCRPQPAHPQATELPAASLVAGCSGCDGGCPQRGNDAHRRQQRGGRAAGAGDGGGADCIMASSSIARCPVQGRHACESAMQSAPASMGRPQWARWCTDSQNAC